MLPDEFSRRAFLRLSSAAGLTAWFSNLAEARLIGNRNFGFATDDAAIEQRLIVPEAVFRPTGTGLTLQWVSAEPLEYQLAAGRKPDAFMIHAEGAGNGPTEVSLKSLNPNELSYWQLRLRLPGQSAWVDRPLRKMHTTRPPGHPFRVALIADSHLYSAYDKPQSMDNLQKTCLRVMEDQPDFVIFLGDEAGVHFAQDRPGTINQQRADQRWAQWRQALSELLFSVPSYMVLGNHEGEAGYYQAFERGKKAGPEYLQRCGTIARKRFFLNPQPDTYTEGGENENESGDPASASLGGAAEGNGSPLQNYYAWTWGDALFVVLDVHRYTRIGQPPPTSPEHWTLGSAQHRWLEKVLAESKSRWKFVISHHLVGGSKWDLKGTRPNSDYVYGRGGAKYARVGEQAQITELMLRHGAGFFLYGHDHVFAHQQAEGIHFVCCGRPTSLQPEWWPTPGWKEAYGNVETRDPHDFIAAIGFTRLDIGPESVTVRYIRTGADRARAENVETAEGADAYSFVAKWTS